MRPADPFRLLVLMTACVALAPAAAQPAPDRGPPSQLNSDRIEQRFGSYGIAVLESDARVRVSNLFSLEAEGAVCRTFAITRYPTEVDPAFAPEHAEIVAGGSIGAVFVGRGWRVERRHLWLGEIPPSPRLLELMGGAAPMPLAIHVFELIVTRGDARFRYATIAEVHHPDYLTLDELYAIFGGEWRSAVDSDPVAGMLALTLEAMR